LDDWKSHFSTYSPSGDNRSSLRVYNNIWHAQQPSEGQQSHHGGPLLQLPDPPLYDAPGDSLLDSTYSLFYTLLSQDDIFLSGLFDGDKKKKRNTK
jgi:hypothetical protein